MYAVIEAGGKQYRVELGTELEVDRLDVEAGSSITLDRVLLVADGETAAIGRPLVSDATVNAEVVRQARGEKLIVFKYGPKTRRRVKKGHRSELTLLRVTDLRFNGRSAADEARRAEDARLTERQRLEEAARRQAEADAALAAKLAAKAKPAPAESVEEPKPKARRATKAVAAPPTEATAKTEKPKRGRAKPAESEPATDTPAPKRTRAKKGE